MRPVDIITFDCYGTLIDRRINPLRRPDDRPPCLRSRSFTGPPSSDAPTGRDCAGPEETTLIVAGYLVWQGYFRLPIVLAVGVISAVAGDNIGYWLGRRYGPVAVARVARWAAVDADRMESMRRFMLRHGALAVFQLITVSHPRHRRPRGMAATPVETEALS